MEGYDWDLDPERFKNSRYNADKDRRQVNEDSYRGAYRFDTTSDHRNVSTWDWSNDQERARRRDDFNQNYNRDFNRNYNRDYNQGYNSFDRDTNRNRGYDHDNYNADSRYYQDQDSRYRSSNSSNWNEQYRPTSDGYGTRFGGDPNREHRSVHDRIEQRDRGALSSFNAHYGPDHYGQGGGASYGNEAGSLSYGYDGSSNYDPDWNRQYNPLTGRLTGQRQSYHGDYTSRHPERGSSRGSYDDQR